MPVADSVIDDIQSRVDLVELISRTTPLKRAGRNWKGCCPFHHEKTPSFMVSPDKQLYYCFGCQAGGNAFTFLMQTEQLTFPEALERLASHVGIRIEQTPGATQQRSAKQAIAATNHVALQYFQESLRGSQGAAARAYVTTRGISDEALQQFALGVAPEAWDGLLRYAATRHITTAQLSAAGLIIPRSEGRDGFYDRFRNRLMFPIHDVHGAIIGFGGRALAADQEPKYMNSPETAAFVKGKQLFGLYFAKQAIAAAGCAILVEGYMDCLMLHQYGITHALAPLGVALTDDHARLLKRYTKDVVLLFDEDDAGAQATLRSLDVLLAEGLAVRIAQLTAGMDPDEFVIAHGAEQLRERLTNAQSLFDYKLAALRRQYPRHQVEDRVAMCHAMLETVRRIPDPVLQRAYVKRLASALQLDEASMVKTLQQPRHARGGQHPVLTASAAPSASPAASVSAETLLLGLLLEDPSSAEDVFTHIAPEQFADPLARQAARLLRQLLEAGGTITPQLLVARSETVEIAGVVARAVHLAEITDAKSQALHDCMAHLKKKYRERQLAQLIAGIQTAEVAGRREEAEQLLREYHALFTHHEDSDHGPRESVSIVQQAR